MQTVKYFVAQDFYDVFPDGNRSEFLDACREVAGHGEGYAEEVVLTWQGEEVKILNVPTIETGNEIRRENKERYRRRHALELRLNYLVERRDDRGITNAYINDEIKALEYVISKMKDKTI